MKKNEVHFCVNECSMNLLEEMNEKNFNNKLNINELIKYCIQIAYIYNKKLEDFEDRNFY